MIVYVCVCMDVDNASKSVSDVTARLSSNNKYCEMIIPS